MDGGWTQQSDSGGSSSAWISMLVRSAGRLNTQTLSSLSTAKPVTPPIFHLLGSGLGHVASTLNLGTSGASAPTRAHAASTVQPTSPATFGTPPRRLMTPPSLLSC